MGLDRRPYPGSRAALRGHHRHRAARRVRPLRRDPPARAARQDALLTREPRRALGPVRQGGVPLALRSGPVLLRRGRCPLHRLRPHPGPPGTRALRSGWAEVAGGRSAADAAGHVRGALPALPAGQHLLLRRRPDRRAGRARRPQRPWHLRGLHPQGSGHRVQRPHPGRAQRGEERRSVLLGRAAAVRRRYAGAPGEPDPDRAGFAPRGARPGHGEDAHQPDLRAEHGDRPGRGVGRAHRSKPTVGRPPAGGRVRRESAVGRTVRARLYQMGEQAVEQVPVAR